LERLGHRQLPPDHLLAQDFARTLTELSHEIRRQVGVLVDRRGAVTHVMVGDATSLELPDWGRLRAGRGRLRGLRCIHTHLGAEPLTRDDLTDLAALRLDAMVAVETSPSGLPGRAHVAYLRPANAEGAAIEQLPPVVPGRLRLDFQEWIRALEEELARSARTHAVGSGERAILVAVGCGRPRAEVEDSVGELKELAASAGVELVDVILQQRPRPDPRTVIGDGRLQDLMIRAFQNDADLVIFDRNLTPAQARNLGERLELRVIDRTQLILDIFAQRARSRDGKLQVELAQLRYRLPRLAQRDDSLSRLAGGIGGRGPGETRLEVDRRRVRERVARLERELAHLRRERRERRRLRDRRGVPVVSIVGYTNAGKSTLLRALTGTDAAVQARMFATLDPTSRRLRLPHRPEAIVTDTVGFIRDLPPDLKQAFRATLEELSEADLFLHVVDAAAPDLERRLGAVRGILAEMGLAGTRELLVFNQVDRLAPGQGAALASRCGGVAISALHGTGLDALLARIEELLSRPESATGDAAPALAATAEGGALR
jgi:GTP-binding protein HflX